MKFAQDSIDDGYVITAYDDDSVSINHKNFSTSLVVSPQTMHEDWPVATIEQLADEHVGLIVELSPELVVIGTGARLTFPPPASYASLIRAGIGVEFMDTGAACRTYNILMSEGRGVVAGLILA